MSLDQWNQALLNELLPLDEGSPGGPVILSCDDEVIGAVIRRLGEPKVNLESLVMDFKSTFGVWGEQGLIGLVNSGASFQASPRPRKVPNFLGGLCLFVLAASRMSPKQRRSTQAYYPLLRDLLHLPGSGEIKEFWYVERLYPYLAEWLEVDCKGTRGHLELPVKPDPPYVSFPISQTVFRERDRSILSQFFVERLTGKFDGMDLLKMLRRWPGKRRLTHHALELVEDEALAKTVRASIKSAVRSWDGTGLELGGGHSLPVWLSLITQPKPVLCLESNNQETISLSCSDLKLGQLYRGSALPLPWSILGILEKGDLKIEIINTKDLLRLPKIGQTLLFETKENARAGGDGLWLTRTVAEEEGCVLTKDPELKLKLKNYPVRIITPLFPWVLVGPVLREDLPAEFRSEPGAGASAVLSLYGGLKVDQHSYLRTGGPILLAGSLDSAESLLVEVDGHAHGRIRSGDTLKLPDEDVGWHQVEVGNGLFSQKYEITISGVSKPEYGSLAYDLVGTSEFKGGATRRGSSSPERACGALLFPPPQNDFPITRSSRSSVFTINETGIGHWHNFSGRPPWLCFPEIKGASRWEIPATGVVWIICPAHDEVIRWSKGETKSLDDMSKDLISQLNSSVKVRDRFGRNEEAQEDWCSLQTKVYKE